MDNSDNIFISYRRTDRDSAENFEAIPDAIEEMTGLKVYWDRELRGGNFLIELMEKDKSADIFMPIVTESYLAFGTQGGRDNDKDFCLKEYAVAFLEGKKIIPICIGTSATATKEVTSEQAAEPAKRASAGEQTDEDMAILKQYLLCQNGITIKQIAKESILPYKDDLNKLIYRTFCESDKISFYKKYLEYEVKRLDPIRIFGDFDDSGLTLGNSYVPLSFLRHLTEKEQKEKEERRESIAPTNAEENTLLTNLENEKLAVIVGDAGQGKSSFAKHLTIQLAQQAQQNGLSRELFFPLYLECKSIDRNAMSSRHTFWNELAEKTVLSRPALDAVMRWGKPFFIFDAMDEIPPDHVDALIDAIYKHIFINNKTTYFLFTSRPGQRIVSGRTDFSLSNDNTSVVRKYSVKEFDESQQELYIDNLAKAKKAGSDIKNTFLQELRNKETVISDYRSISRNPFMLFAIFCTYTNGQDLPENRFDAISRVIDDIIERDLKKRDYSPINKKNIKEILGAVSCLFYRQRDMGKAPHANMQTPYDLAEKIYRLDDSDRDDRRLLNKYREFFGKSNLLDENGFRHDFLASTYAAYYLLFLMKSKVKKEKSPIEVNDISSLKKDTDYWKGVTEALLCLIDRESEDSKTYIEPLIDELQNTETPDYGTLCRAVSQFVNYQPRAAYVLLSGMLKRGCDGIMYGEQTDSGFICHKGVNPYEELFYYPAIYPYLQQYLSNLTTGTKQGKELYLCGEIIRELCALFSNKYYQNLQNVYNGRNGSAYPDVVQSLADAADRRGWSIHGYVRVRDGEIEIGDWAFSDCTDLTGITIPDSVTEICKTAFYYCTGLTNIYVCDNNSHHSSIDGVLFNKEKTAIIVCPAGKTGTYSIPDSVTEIRSGAFNNCTGLTGITIPDSVIEIGEYAFSDCTGLTGITITDSVIEIGVDAFCSCTGLTEINVGDNNLFYSSIDGVLYNKMKTGIIYYPSGRKGEYTIPDNVTEIGYAAFADCTGLTEISIPTSVIEIGVDAFWSCTGLIGINVCDNNPCYSSIDGVLFNNNKTDIILYPAGRTGGYTIPDCATKIGDWVFCNSTGLTSITIPTSVTEIIDNAFHFCKVLTSINVCTNNFNYSSIDGVLFNKEKTAIIVCPAGKTGTYSIPDSVTEIRSGAFNNCTGLTGITIPDSVIEIGKYAFSDCTGLTGITIPDSVTEIGAYAFEGCTGLTIHGKKGSYAETYAEENNIPFVAE